MKKLIIIALAAMLLTSCATIISGTKQTVIFSAMEGTAIYSEGIIMAEIPSGYKQVAVEIPRSLNSKFLTARKDGYQDTNFFLRPSVNGVVFVNILLLPGVLIGGAIDCATGAAAKYPEYIQIIMYPETGTTSEGVTIEEIMLPPVVQ